MNRLTCIKLVDSILHFNSVSKCDSAVILSTSVAAGELRSLNSERPNKYGSIDPPDDVPLRSRFDDGCFQGRNCSKSK